jgi:hypothetical protein
MKLAAVIIAGAGLALAGTSLAGAAPTGNQSPNSEPAFDVVCDGVGYTLIDAPASGEHAEFTPAFSTTGGTVVVPYYFDATQTATVLTDGAVIEGTAYDAGDILFSGSETLGIGTKRAGGQSCTFEFSGVESFTDDNGNPVEVSFGVQGTALAKLPNTH